MNAASESLPFPISTILVFALHGLLKEKHHPLNPSDAAFCNPNNGPMPLFHINANCTVDGDKDVFVTLAYIR